VTGNGNGGGVFGGGQGMLVSVGGTVAPIVAVVVCVGEPVTVFIGVAVLLAVDVLLAVGVFVANGIHVTVDVVEGVLLRYATCVAGLGVVLCVVLGIAGVGVIVAQNGPSRMTGFGATGPKLG
jgi:hypothetical protein